LLPKDGKDNQTDRKKREGQRERNVREAVRTLHPSILLRRLYHVRNLEGSRTQGRGVHRKGPFNGEGADCFYYFYS